MLYYLPPALKTLHAIFWFLGTYYTINKYLEIRDTAGSQTVEFTTNLDYWYNLQYTWLALGTFLEVTLSIYFQMNP